MEPEDKTATWAHKGHSQGLKLQGPVTALSISFYLPLNWLQTSLLRDGTLVLAAMNKHPQLLSFIFQRALAEALAMPNHNPKVPNTVEGLGWTWINCGYQWTRLHGHWKVRWCKPKCIQQPLAPKARGHSREVGERLQHKPSDEFIMCANSRELWVLMRLGNQGVWKERKRSCKEGGLDLVPTESWWMNVSGIFLKNMQE